MENKIVFEVTDRGDDELSGRSTLLFGDMKRAFLMVDGESTFGEISKRIAPSLRSMLPELMKDLQAGGFIQDKEKGGMEERMVAPRMVTPAQADLSLKNSESNERSELDFTSSMPIATPEMMEAEAARLQAEKSQREAQVLAAALKSQQEAEAVRLQAEQEARDARLAAIARAEQQARAASPPVLPPAQHSGASAVQASAPKQIDVARTPVQPVIHAGQAAPSPADMVQSRRLRREAEEREMLEAQARQLAAEQAKIWAEAAQHAVAAGGGVTQKVAAPTNQPAASQVPPVPEIKPSLSFLSWLMLMALLSVLVLVALFVVPFVLPEQKYAHQLEQILSVKFQQPVHVGHLAGRILPTPRLVLGDVYIGEAKQIKAKQVQIDFAMLSLLSSVKPIDSIELQGLQVSGAALQQMAFWMKQVAADDALPVKHMLIHQGALDGNIVQLSDIEGDLNFDAQGVFIRGHLAAGAGRYLLDIEGGPSSKLKLALLLRDAALPLLPNWLFAELSAKGELDKGDLAISEFAAHIAGGMLSGSARLDWHAGWSAQGSLEAKAVAMQKLSNLLEGDAEGSARFRMQAETLADLADSVMLEGVFSARKGTILGMDIVGTASLHSKEHMPGGRTSFDELNGTFAHSGDSYHFRQMQVTTQLLDATAALDVNAQQLSGKVNAKLLTQGGGVLPVDLQIGGTTESPTLRAIR